MNSDLFLGCLERRAGVLHLEGVALPEIAARFGTPCFVYSRAALERSYRDLSQAFQPRPHLICYAVKANGNLAILDVFARLGAGFDIVSGGELRRVLAAGGDSAKTVFSGVGKSAAEIRQALSVGIMCFNVESASELARIEAIAAQMNVRAPISLRVNPDVDPQTHPYISTGLRNNKFGIPIEEAVELYQRAARSPSLQVVGIDFHIGSQITDASPFADAIDKVIALVERLERHAVRLAHIDIGGGSGITYRDEEALGAADYANAVLPRLARLPHKLVLEPGRALVGNAGVLLTRVEYLKRGAEKNFAVVDAAMNDLLRPALYDAHHEIVAVAQGTVPLMSYDVVGPVCESADFLGLDRKLAIAEGDLLAVLSVGAYGASMSSNYNTRPRAIELMIDGHTAHVVRERESVEALFAFEHPLPSNASPTS